MKRVKGKKRAQGGYQGLRGRSNLRKKNGANITNLDER